MVKNIVYLTTYLNSDISRDLDLPFSSAGLKKKNQLIDLLIPLSCIEVIFVSSFTRIDRFASMPKSIFCNGVRVNFPVVFYFLGLNYILNPVFTALKLLEINRRNSIDIVICYNAVYESIVSAFIYTKIFRKKAKIIVQYEDGFIYNTSFFKRGIMYFAHILAENTAHSAIINSRRIKEVFRVRDYFIFRGFSTSTVSTKVEKAQKLNVLFSGSIDNIRGVELLINIFEKGEINSNMKNYNFQITGDGDPSVVKRLCAAIIHFNSIGGSAKYYGFIGRSELHNLYHKGHVLLALQNPNLSFSKYCFPSKVMEYYPYNRPIVTTDISDLRDGDFINLTFIDYDSDDLLQKLLDIRANYDEYLIRSSMNSVYILERYNKTNTERNMDEFLVKTIQRG